MGIEFAANVSPRCQGNAFRERTQQHHGQQIEQHRRQEALVGLDDSFPGLFRGKNKLQGPNHRPYPKENYRPLTTKLIELAAGTPPEPAGEDALRYAKAIL